MAIWIAASLYTVVAGLAAFMTLNEQRNRRTGLVLRLCGFAACVIWPFAIIVMFCMMIVHAAMRRCGVQARTSLA